ncbi:MAG: DUF2752 domain-containing protein [Planctomycetes bacterium]|nr:DUF2752 domain-containing protein [Planctomycetota bacterium]
MHASAVIAPPASLRARATLGDRAIGALVACVCLSVVAIACWLTPADQGFGTHRQLGLAPCGWAVAFGKPCLTCGMTTSFSLMAHGRIVDSFLAQPAGAVLSVLTAAFFWPAAHQAVLGSLALHRCGVLFSTRMLWIGGIGLAAAWAYKFVTWPSA